MRGRCADGVSTCDGNSNTTMPKTLRNLDDPDDEWWVVDLPADRRDYSVEMNALADDTCWERDKNMTI